MIGLRPIQEGLIETVSTALTSTLKPAGQPFLTLIHTLLTECLYRNMVNVTASCTYTPTHLHTTNTHQQPHTSAQPTHPKHSYTQIYSPTRWPRHPHDPGTGKGSDVCPYLRNTPLLLWKYWYPNLCSTLLSTCVHVLSLLSIAQTQVDCRRSAPDGL